MCDTLIAPSGNSSLLDSGPAAHGSGGNEEQAEVWKKLNNTLPNSNILKPS